MSWDTLCLEKEQGGFGLRNMEVMNKALLGRLAWNTMTKPNVLVSAILREKYGRGADLYKECIVKNSDSVIWKGLADLWGSIVDQIAWECRNGNKIRFWEDLWLSDDEPLFRKAVQKPAGRLIDCKVKDMVNERGEWEFIFLKDYLGEHEVLRLRATLVPYAEAGEDLIRWRGSGGSNYITSDMYQKLRGGSIISSDAVWSRVWKCKGPRRVQVHLWICIHDRLLTASRRSRLVGGSPTCVRCREGEEDLLHALRDCRVARDIWKEVGGSTIDNEFFSSHHREWFERNMNKESSWVSRFAVTCWWQWHWRNKSLFEEGFVMPTRPDLIINKYIWEMENLGVQHSLLSQLRHTGLIRWVAPAEGCFKLNFDGSVKGSVGMAGCGGVLRDWQGKWVKGYVVKLGICNVYNAELWGVLWGLRMAKEMGVGNLLVEGDSSAVISTLSD